MAITPRVIVGFPIGANRYSNITPFTYQDGLTYIEKLEQLGRYIRDTLVPHVDSQYERLVEAWEQERLALVEQVNEALADQAANVNLAIEQLIQTVNDRVSSLSLQVGVAVEDHRIAGDTDNDAIKRAIEVAKTGGYASVVFTRPLYTLEYPIDIDGCRNMTIRGLGTGTRFIGKADVPAETAKFFGAFSINRTISGSATQRVTIPGVGAVFGEGVGASNIRFENFTVDGSLTNADIIAGSMARNYPEHTVAGVEGRKFAANRLGSFLDVVSTYNSSASGYVDFPKVSDIVVDNVNMIGLSGLPVNIRGVYGKAHVLNSTIERCLDTGFTFSEDVVFDNNTVRFSADNGVSASRGNHSVRVTDNNFYGSWSSHIWVAGFDGNLAPKRIIVTGNHCEWSGSSSIQARIGPQTLIITNNILERAMRGRENELTEIDTAIYTGHGICLGGDGVSNPARFTLIDANIFLECKRSAVYLYRDVYDVIISNNIMHNIGSPYRADLTTPVPEDGQWNLGVITNSTVFVGNISIVNNRMSSDQTMSIAGVTTAVTHGLTQTPAIQTWIERGNIVTGARRNIDGSGLNAGSAVRNTEVWATIGTLASDTAKGVRYQSGGADRFKIEQLLDKLSIRGVSNGGTPNTMMEFDRNTLGASVIRPFKLAVYGDNNLTPALAVTFGEGAIVFNTTTKKYMGSNGTTWDALN